MMKYIFYIIGLSFLYYLFYSCASPSSPTGGPRDTIPPKLLIAEPELQCTNYNGKTITLTFDERIKTTKLKEQLIITPLTTSKYDVVVKKNILKITFEQPFNDSTTYTLNFRESIQDLTEGNPTKNNKITFSTGNFIDSLSITGYVKDHLTYDTLKNIVVGLYRAQDTVTIYNGSPYYFTEVDEKGKYLIENIKNGKYLLYAFLDENKNLKLETNKEAYSFFKDTLSLDSGTTIVNLNLIKLDLTQLKLMSALVSGQYFEINFNKFIADFDINSINTEQNIYANMAKQNKSIRIYNNFQGIDSLQVSFTANDSIDNTITDTIFVKFTSSMRKKDEIAINILPKERSAVEPKFTTEIKFNKPIKYISLDSIILRYDTIPIYNVPASTIKISKHRDHLSFDVFIDKIQIDTIEAIKKRILEATKDTTQTKETNQQQTRRQAATREVNKSLKSNQGLQLYFGKGSFISADNDTIGPVGYNYVLINPEKFGTQQISIETTYESFEVQLVKENFEVIQKTKNNKNFKFRHIEPGKYKIRVLIDEDNDGIWSPGNMLKQIEPEPVYIFPEVLIIRADWETSLSLTF